MVSIDHEKLSDSSHTPDLLSSGQIPISDQALKEEDPTLIEKNTFFERTETSP